MLSRSCRAALPALFAVLVAQAACGNGLEDEDPDGGALPSLGVVGQACDSLRPCRPGLTCYAGSNPLLLGLCTMTCTGAGATDTCAEKYPSTICLAAGVCGASCSGGKACPSGSACNTTVEICVNAANSCATAGDGICSEPAPCTPGTDTADCG